MRDLRAIQTPSSITYETVPIGNTTISEITGQPYTVQYTRPLWNGTYIWDTNANLQI